MDIFKVIKEKSCSIDFKAKNKQDCIKKLADLISLSVEELDSDAIFEALMERENSGSTGFDSGIAIPHAKLKGLKEFSVCIAVSKKGIDFDSIDKKKSFLFFVIIGPEERTNEHLQILAQISRLSRNRNTQKELHNAKNVEALIEAFIHHTSESMKTQKITKKHKLLFVILNELRFYDDILEIFIGQGITGVNIIDSSGVKDQLSNIPLFGDFLNFLGERTDERKTIMAIIPESEVNKITLSIEELMGDLDKHTGAMVMALDIPYIKGTLEA